METTETIQKPTNKPPRRVSGGPKKAHSLTPGQTKRLSAIQTDASSVSALFKRVFEGVATQRECIKAQCLDCCGLDKMAVAECGGGDKCCPLWRVRPYQKKRAQV